jgi:hypothetical protein
VHQAAALHVALLTARAHAAPAISPGAKAWIQVARGRVRLGTVPLEAGDGAAVTGASMLELVAEAQSEVLLFELR